MTDALSDPARRHFDSAMENLGGALHLSQTLYQKKKKVTGRRRAAACVVTGGYGRDGPLR